MASCLTCVAISNMVAGWYHYLEIWARKFLELNTDSGLIV